jgi:hypothetical protein
MKLIEVKSLIWAQKGETLYNLWKGDVNFRDSQIQIHSSTFLHFYTYINLLQSKISVDETCEYMYIWPFEPEHHYMNQTLYWYLTTNAAKTNKSDVAYKAHHFIWKIKPYYAPFHTIAITILNLRKRLWACAISLTKLNCNEF